MEPVGKGASTNFVLRATTHSPPLASTGRSGARIETAKELFGALSPSTSTALVPSGLEVRLANDETSGSLGFELLSLYSDSATSDPLFPPPVFDWYSLKSRFQAV
jgi:hypothetical protein